MRRKTPSPHCRSLLADLSQLMDGELTPSRRRAIERHLAGCECCEEIAARLRLTVAACRAADAAPLPAAVRRRAAARIRRLLSGARR